MLYKYNNLQFIQVKFTVTKMELKAQTAMLDTHLKH